MAELGDGPRSLIFDANIFLNLAKVPGNIPVIKAIHKAVQSRKEFILIVPEPVAAAVIRLREDAIKGHWDLLSESLKQWKSFMRDLAADSGAFDAMGTQLHATIQERRKQLPESIAAMDALLAAGTVVKPEPRHYQDAAERFLSKRAPAHTRKDKKREHTAILNDCIIWSIVKEEILTRPVELVSSDGDFKSPTHNEKLHEDLAAEVVGKLKFHTLEDFLKAHVTAPPPVVSPPSWWGQSRGEWKSICPVCGSSKIDPAGTPRPSQYGGWSYQQYCPDHKGYVETGEPYDD